MGKLSKREALKRRHRSIRRRLAGTAERPRMSVCCTANHIYVQFIDDDAGRTLASASTVEPAVSKEGVALSVEGAQKLWKTASERARAADIEAGVFDPGGFKYRGRVKAVAEAAREAGLVL